LLPHDHINPGAIGWHTGLGGSVPVGMGLFETRKVPVVWFPVLFLYFSGFVRNLISITSNYSRPQAGWDLRCYAAPAPK